MYLLVTTTLHPIRVQQSKIYQKKEILTYIYAQLLDYLIKQAIFEDFKIKKQTES